MPSAKATAIFDGNDAALQRTIKGIGRSLGAMQRRFRAGAGELGAGALNLARTGVVALGAAGVAAGIGLAIGVKHAYDLGGSLSDMSAKTGIAVDQLMVLNQAGKDAGIEDLSGSVAKMQRNLVAAVKDGAGPAGQALNLLGLDAAALARQLPSDALSAIGAKIAALQNPALKTAVAMDLFGKSGSQLLPLFANSGALGEAAAAIGSQAAILRDNAARFDAVSDRLGHAGLKLQGFFVGVAERVLPYMEAITARLDQLDLASQGQRFGDGIKVAVDFLAGAFADPSALFGTAIQFLKAGVLGAGNLLIAGVKLAGELLGSPALLTGLAQGFAGLGMIMQAGLMRAFAVGISYLQAGIEAALEALPESMGGRKSAASKAKAKLGENLQRQDELMHQLKVTNDPMFPKDQREGTRAGIAAEMKGLMKDAVRLTRISRSGPSLTERAQANREDGDTYASIEAAAKDKIAEGQRLLSAGVSGTFDAAIAAFGKVQVEDVLGAGAELAKGVGMFRAAAAKGSAMIAAAMAVAAPVLPKARDPFAYAAGGLGGRGLSGASMAGSKAGFYDIFHGDKKHLFAGGIGQTSALNRGAYGQSPILGRAERRAFEDSMVASGGTRHSSSPGAYGAIAKGDAARRKNAAREEERKRLHDLASGQAQLTELKAINKTLEEGLL